MQLLGRKEGAHGGTMGSPVSNARELELKAKLERELPIEEDLTRWLAPFDAPV